MLLKLGWDKIKLINNNSKEKLMSEFTDFISELSKDRKLLKSKINLSDAFLISYSVDSINELKVIEGKIEIIIPKNSKHTKPEVLLPVEVNDVNDAAVAYVVVVDLLVLYVVVVVYAVVVLFDVPVALPVLYVVVVLYAVVVLKLVVVFLLVPVDLLSPVLFDVLYVVVVL